MTIQKITYRDPSPEELDSEGKIIGVDNRNVSDEYKNIPLEMIKESLDEKRLPLVNVFVNLTSDFNKASGVRASNAFLASEVYFIGKRRYARKGTVGTHHYEHINHAPEVKEVVDHLHEEGYKIFAVDNSEPFNPVSVYEAVIPLKSAFIFGEEELGLSEDVVKMCDASISIPQFGSVRSLNVSQAAAVLMSEYSRRHRFNS